MTYRELPLYKESSYLNVSHEKARTMGFRASDLSETIKKTKTWFEVNTFEQSTPELIRCEQLSFYEEEVLLRKSG